MNNKQKKVYDLSLSGHNSKQISEKLGISLRSVARRLKEARSWVGADPAIVTAAKAAGIQDPSTLSHFWKITKDESGNGYSVFVKNPTTGEELSFVDMIKDCIEESSKPRAASLLEKRETFGKGKNLLVIDLADVHFGKLCVKSEVGSIYNREVAKHRVIEGTRTLLSDAEGFGISHILFVLGNDIINIDDHKGETTAGTNQDGEGSLFQMWRDAYDALGQAIELCKTYAPVTLVHCMSNHDWKMGWSLSQAIGASFQNDKDVSTTEYNLSENHRKYFRFGKNLIGLTHGDGVKEEKLMSVMVAEAREHIGECRNLYWLLHHLHHKIRKQRGVDVFQSEKDHVGMTAIISGSPKPEGVGVSVEYVRSPSPADGWHHRNGYINRQGVECFLYHPFDGQFARFTKWF